MSDMLHITDDDAALMLYLADELPARDRSEMERRLVGDGALRQRLEEMRALQGFVHSQFEMRDEVDGIQVDGAASRRVASRMRSYQLQLASKPSEEAVGHSSFRIHWAVYPFAAAAAIGVVLLGLWGMGVFDPTVNPGGGGAKLVKADTTNHQRMAAELERSLSLGAVDEEHRLMELPDSEDRDYFML